MSTIAIIGGTGLERLPPPYHLRPVVIETRFGTATAARAQHDTEEFIFLSRHGEGHSLAPHRINYRANIAALVQLGVTRILATNAVGALRRDLPPGSLVLLSDFLDFTRSRPLSFWDDAPDSPAPVVHTDFSEPYCPELRQGLIEAAADSGIELIPRGIYLCAEGPRFESPAEVRLFANWGADVVGMTGLPEAVFAREAGLCYAAIAIVTNFGAGLTAEPVAHEEVVKRMEGSADTMRSLLMAGARRIPEARACRCGQQPSE